MSLKKCMIYIYSCLFPNKLKQLNCLSKHTPITILFFFMPVALLMLSHILK